MTDVNGQTDGNGDRSHAITSRGWILLRHLVQVVFLEELVRQLAAALAPKLAAKLWIVLAKLCCAGLLLLGLRGELSSQCASVLSQAELALAMRELQPLNAIFYLVLWAEVFFGAALLYRMRSDAPSRFKVALGAWSGLCVLYYGLALRYGTDEFVHSTIKETLYLGMSTLLVELADQKLRFRVATLAMIYISAVVIAATTMIPSVAPYVPMILTSIYGVSAAALAGAAWWERLNNVERVFWSIYVLSLLYRIPAYDAGVEELVVYYALMNAKWVTLSACCGARIEAAAPVASGLVMSRGAQRSGYPCSPIR